MGFGIQNSGFYIDTDVTKFEVGANMNLSDDFSAIGRLGFLQVDVLNGIDTENGDTQGTGINTTFTWR